jgi:hypothetical protein
MRTTALMAAASLAAALAGCSAGEPFDDPFAYYGQRIMTVSPSAGNMQAANAALQTVDPWPPYVNNTRIAVDGPRMVKAVQTYESGGGAGGATSSGGTGGSGSTGAATTQ